MSTCSPLYFFFFFFNDTATTEIYTLSLHDALPICIGQVLVRLLAPIMSFATEEVWQFMPSLGEKPDSVHLALFPTAEEVLGNTERQPDPKGQSVPRDTDRIWTDWQRLLLVREEVFRALETARKD